MTEAEWLTTKLPLYMLRQYPAAWDTRKARLFWAACLRRSWQLLTDDRTRRLVELVEDDPGDARGRFDAESQAVHDRFIPATPSYLFSFHPDIWTLGPLMYPPPGSLMGLVGDLADHAANAAAGDEPDPDSAFAARERGAADEKARQCDLIREVFGNPFRPVDFAPWRTSDAVALARGIYDEKAFDRMPILADALQDAGCDDANVLDHCRDARDHARGCWVIDSLLEKG